MPDQQAGSPVTVYAWVQCLEPKTGEQRVQLSREDETLCPSGYIIYLWGGGGSAL